ncbi:MAG TPA: hypothetical protein DDX51_04745 [Clostridiales bacterium]|nr:hypothetical protein [Clostridiales bacterium]
MTLPQLYGWMIEFESRIHRFNQAIKTRGILRNEICKSKTDSGLFADHWVITQTTQKNTAMYWMQRES